MALGPAPEQTSAGADAVPASGPAAAIFADAETALTGLAEAAQASEDGDDARAEDLEKQAMRDLRDFYEELRRLIMGTAIRKHLRDFVAIGLLLIVGLGCRVRDRPEPAAAHPDPRGAPLRAQGRVRDRAGHRPRPGADPAGRRRQGRRRREGRARGRRRGRHLRASIATTCRSTRTRRCCCARRPACRTCSSRWTRAPRRRARSRRAARSRSRTPRPQVNLDELLLALDSDTQAYLRLLLVGAGEGLDGRGKDLGKVLGSLGPITRDLDAINRKVAERKENLRSLITNFNELTKEVGRSEQALTDLVTSSNAAIGAIAEQDPSVQRAIQQLPGTLEQSTITLNNVAAFADQLGPAFDDLRPFARNLDELNASTRKLAVRTTPVIKDEIRPFVRSARKPIPDLNRAASRLSKATPKLTVVARKINKLGNMAAYNPNGAEPPGTPNRDEGYLFWAAWLGHNSGSVFQVQDAHGVDRRIYLTIGCDEALSLLGSSPLAPAVTGLGQLFAPGGPFAGAC